MRLELHYVSYIPPRHDVRIQVCVCVCVCVCVKPSKSNLNGYRKHAIIYELPTSITIFFSSSDLLVGSKLSPSVGVTAQEGDDDV